MCYIYGMKFQCPVNPLIKELRSVRLPLLFFSTSTPFFHPYCLTEVEPFLFSCYRNSSPRLTTKSRSTSSRTTFRPSTATTPTRNCSPSSPTHSRSSSGSFPDFYPPCDGRRTGDCWRW